jgi:hypothetical protein
MAGRKYPAFPAFPAFAALSAFPAVACLVSLLGPALFAGPVLADDLADMARESAEFASASDDGSAPPSDLLRKLPSGRGPLGDAADMPDAPAASEPGGEIVLPAPSGAAVRPDILLPRPAVKAAPRARLDRGPPSPSFR